MRIETFTLEDCQGVPHTYEVERFSCDENAALQLIVARPLLQAVARLIGVLAPAISETGIVDKLQSIDENTEPADLIPDLVKALQHIDWFQAPEVIGVIFDCIVEHGGPALVARLFARTTRLTEIPEAVGAPNVEGHTLDPNFRLALRDADARDQAFADDGNMLEYWQAAVKVMLVNFLPRGRNGSSGWSALLPALTGGLLKRSATTGTERPKPASGTGS